jgi:hypothetical protein
MFKTTKKNASFNSWFIYIQYMIENRAKKKVLIWFIYKIQDAYILVSAEQHVQLPYRNQESLDRRVQNSVGVA